MIFIKFPFTSRITREENEQRKSGPATLNSFDSRITRVVAGFVLTVAPLCSLP